MYQMLDCNCWADWTNNLTHPPSGWYDTEQLNSENVTLATKGHFRCSLSSDFTCYAFTGASIMQVTNAFGPSYVFGPALMIESGIPSKFAKFLMNRAASISAVLS